MLDKNSFYDKETIEKIFNIVNDIVYSDTDRFSSLEEVMNDLNLRGYLFHKFISEQVSFLRRKKDFNPESLLEFYDIDFLSIVLSYSQYSISSDVLHILYKVFPYLELSSLSQVSSWQWYSESIDPEQNIHFFNLFKDLPQPFNNNNFKVVPIANRSYQIGFCSLEYLKNEKGAYVERYTKEGKKELMKTDSSHYCFFLDAKLGLAFYYKNKPAFFISFNFDNNKNIYIHQIQGVIKGRGHYHLKNWQEDCILYLKKAFPEYNLHLLNGSDVVKNVLQGYNNSKFKPSKNSLNKIKNNYNSIFSNCSNFINKRDLSYRILFKYDSCNLN